MRRKSTTLTVTAAAAAAAAVLAMPATAQALPQPGIIPVGPVTLTANQSITLLDMSTGGSVVCDDSTLNGNVPPNQPPNLVITSGSFSSPSEPGGMCSGPGIPTQITPANLPWSFTVTSFDGANAAGSFAGVTVVLHDAFGCDATITGPGGTPGTLQAVLENATGEFTFTGGNLEVATADADCDPGLINVGDQIGLDASYGTTPQLSYSP